MKEHIEQWTTTLKNSLIALRAWFLIMLMLLTVSFIIGNIVKDAIILSLRTEFAELRKHDQEAQDRVREINRRLEAVEKAPH